MVILILRGGLFSKAVCLWIIQGLSLILLLWARFTLGLRSIYVVSESKTGFIRKGPYRYIRHPIYTAGILFIWSGILFNRSLPNIFLGAVILIGFIVRIICEEEQLLNLYPDYKEYSEKTKRMIPFIF